MKLKEIYYTRTLNSYWMNADHNQLYKLPSNTIHSQFALDNPHLFELTPEEIKHIQSLPLDDLREEVYQQLINKGWIRIGSSFGTDIELQAEDPFDAVWALKKFIDLEGDPTGIEIDIQGSWYQLPQEKISLFLKNPSSLSKIAHRVQ